MKRKERAHRRVASVRKQSCEASIAHVPLAERLREVALPFGLLLFAVILFYARTARFDFVDWDDDTNVFQNPLIISPTWERFTRIWAHPYASLYVPLVYTSYLFDALIGGSEPPIYHLSNAFYHLVAGCAVFLILRDLIKVRAAAIVGALVFVLHPMQAEAVAWVTGRKDVLSGCLSLLALWRFSTFLKTARVSDIIAATVLFLGALLSKPSAIVVPLLAGALALHQGATRKQLVVSLVPWFLLSAIWTVINFMSQTGFEDAPFVVAMWKRPFLAADSLIFYMRKAICPVGLSPIYPRTVPGVFSNWLVWIELPALAALCLFLWFRRGIPALAFAWFAIGVLPILGFTPFLFQYYSTVADRYGYLAQLGTALFVAWVVQYVALMVKHQSKISLILGVALVCYFALLAWKPIGWWYDSESLWKRVLVMDPQSKHAHYNLGTHYAVHGRLDEARPQFQEVIKLDPTYAPAYDHLIKMEMEAGKEEASNKISEEAIKRLPAASVENYVALGTAYLQLGKYPEAVFNFRAAIAGYPEDTRQYNNLGIALMRNKDLKGAEEAFREAVAINDKFQLAQANLGLCLMLQNRLQESADQFRLALALQPNDQRSAKVLKAIEDQLAKK